MIHLPPQYLDEYITWCAFPSLLSKRTARLLDCGPPCNNMLWLASNSVINASDKDFTRWSTRLLEYRTMHIETL